MEGSTPRLEVPRRGCRVIEEGAGGENEGVRELGRVAERAGGCGRPLGVEALVASGLMLLEANAGDLLGECRGGVEGIREPREAVVVREVEMEDTLETAVEVEAVEIVDAVERLRTTVGGLTDTLPRAREDEEAGLGTELEEGPFR